LRWLNQCDRNGLSVRQRCLVAALDEVSAEAVDASRLRRIALEPPGGSVSPEATASFVRALLLLECLENDVDVLLQPAAVVWRQDPIPWLEQGRGDVQLSSDKGSGRAFPIFGNPRFCFVRAHRRCRAARETILGNFAWLLDRGDERPLVNRVLGHLVAHNLLDVRVLPEACFAPGGEVPQRGDAGSIIVSIGS
ncbi:MAG: putative nucleotide-diphospho-sugar transferase, partial [Pseudomonadota bacterium]